MNIYIYMYIHVHKIERARDVRTEAPALEEVVPRILPQGVWHLVVLHHVVELVLFVYVV